MAVKIRLARIGRKKAPAFKIVVSNIRDKRNGRYLDIIGHYNPSMTPIDQSFDEKKYNKWVSQGAQVSDAVKAIKDGTYKYIPYTRQNEKSDEDEATPSDNSDKEEKDENKSEESKSEK